MNKVLFTSVGRRVQLVKHFLGCGWDVIGVDANPDECAVKQVIQTMYRVPQYHEDNYFETLLNICRLEKVSCLVPLFEPELVGLSKRKSAFLEHGINVVVSNENVLESVLDKYHLSVYLQEKKYSTPETFNDYSTTDASSLWVVKPRSGMGSKDVYIAEQQEVPFFFNKVRNPIVQRFIKGQEYSIDVFVDYVGRILSAVPRLRLEVRAGEVSKSMTVNEGDITGQTVNLVKQLGIYGPATIQGIKEHSTGMFYFTDVNPRFGGGVPLSIQAGIPYAEFLKDGFERKTKALHSYQPNLKMLRYDEAFYVE